MPTPVLPKLPSVQRLRKSELRLDTTVFASCAISFLRSGLLAAVPPFTSSPSAASQNTRSAAERPNHEVCAVTAK
jgi:hypothetical protein